MTEDARLLRYQIMEPIAEGGQATTYRAVDRHTGAEVAIKVLQLAGSDGWKGFELFERECQTLASLAHPGIPTFIDHFESQESGDYFLVMELINGRRLAAEVATRSKPDRPAFVQTMLDQGLEILDYIHASTPPVIHRDVKPDNLLVDETGRLRLIDFGGVHRIGTEPSDGRTMVGTVGFMAPEQLHGEALPSSDLYSLAASILSVLTQRAPETFPRDGLRIQLDDLLPNSRLKSTLRRLLEPDPRNRPASVAALRKTERIHATDEHQGPRVTARPTETSSSPHSRSSASARRKTTNKSSRNTQVPATQVPTAVVQLAQTRNPVLRPALWVISALASGVLVLAEAVALPPLFRWLRSRIARKDSAALARHERQRAEVNSAVRSSREALQYLAERTNPLDNDSGR